MEIHLCREFAVESPGEEDTVEKPLACIVDIALRVRNVHTGPIQASGLAQLKPIGLDRAAAPG